MRELNESIDWHNMPTDSAGPQDSPMPTRNVVLTDHQAEFVESLVRSGRYQNASEVLREGLRLIESREEEDRARLKALREAVRLGIEDIEAGRFKDFKSAEDLRKHLATVAREARTKRSSRGSK